MLPGMPLHAAASGFDPLTWSPTNYFRADGLTSTSWANAPGGTALALGDAPALVSLNGRTIGDFNGSSDLLQATVNTPFTTAEGSGWCLFWADTAAAHNATPYQNPGLLVDTNPSFAYWGMSFSNSGFIAHCLFGGYCTAVATCATGAWKLGQMRFDANFIEARVNRGQWTRTASGAAAQFSAAMRMGANYSAGFLFDGRLAEVATVPTRRSDDDFNALVGFLEGYHRISLT